MSHSPAEMAAIAVMIEVEIGKFSNGLESRLAIGMTKALDIVTGEQTRRLQALEEDQARILRHLGLEE